MGKESSPQSETSQHTIPAIIAVVCALIGIAPFVIERFEKPSSTDNQSKLEEISSSEDPQRDDRFDIMPGFEAELMVYCKKGKKWRRQHHTLKSKDKFRIEVELSKPVQLYVFQRDTLGKVYQIFPANQEVRDYCQKKNLPILPNPIGPGTFVVPNSKVFFGLNTTVGTDNFYLFYSKKALQDPMQVFKSYLDGTTKIPNMQIKSFTHK